jgi:hypothetical protein
MKNSNASTNSATARPCRKCRSRKAKYFLFPQFSMFHWILWERAVLPGRCHCSTQVCARCVLERHEICNRSASDERGHNAFSTMITTVGTCLVAALRIDMSLLDWELRRLIVSSAVYHDVRKVSVEIYFDIGLWTDWLWFLSSEGIWGLFFIVAPCILNIH